MIRNNKRFEIHAQREASQFLTSTKSYYNDQFKENERMLGKVACMVQNRNA